MSNQTEFQLSPLEKITLKVFVVVLWAAAFLVWMILAWYREAFTHFGMELPALTQLILHSVWVYSPFVCAALLSSFVIYQLYHPHSRTILQSAWGLGVWVIYLLFVLLAVSLPFLPACAAVE
jgi:hypothetical protein